VSTVAGGSGRAPTIVDVAELAGVSKSLVSLVMRGSPSVSPARRQAVLAAAAQLGYRPNGLARRLVEGRTRTLAVLIKDLSNPFFVDVFSGIQEEATRFGYRVLLGSPMGSAAREHSALEGFAELRAEGVILLDHDCSAHDLEHFASLFPIVVVGRREPPELPVDSVADDDEAGAALAVAHLAELGHRRIAHLASRSDAGQARLAGYRRAMADLGLQDLIDVAYVRAETDAGGHAAAVELLDRAAAGCRPTAFVAFNDVVALGAYNALDEAGLRIPHDVSVVGYDNTSLASMLHISLTTIHQPRLEMGRIGARLLLERCKGKGGPPRRETLEPTLLVRSSSGRPPTRAPRKSAALTAGAGRSPSAR